jgi:hypothetical protein
MRCALPQHIHKHVVVRRRLNALFGTAAGCDTLVHLNQNDFTTFHKCFAASLLRYVAEANKLCELLAKCTEGRLVWNCVARSLCSAQPKTPPLGRMSLLHCCEERFHPR